MSRFKKSTPWVVGVAGVASLTLSAWSWAQRGPLPPVVSMDPQAIAAANSLSQAFRAASQNSLPAIVSIEVRGKPVSMRGGEGLSPEMFKGSPFEELFKQDPRFKEFFGPRGGGSGPLPRPQGMGSGFLIDSRGVIMTAAHVVADADQVKVRLHDGREYVATEVKADPKTDIAIVKIEAEGPLPSLPMANSDEIEVGDWVLAIGSPFGLDATVTAGIISAKGRGPSIAEREDFLQTDAAINPGNSGGPLVNLRGEVVGVNTAISTRGGGTDGVGFTVPINLARWVGDQLATTGKVTRAYLGVVIQQLDDKLSRQFGVAVGKGALVTEILAGSPAAEGGVEVGDLVLKFNDRDVRGTRDLQSIVERCRAGESVPMQIVREGKDKTLSITLKEMPQNFSLRRTGTEEGPGAGPAQPEKPVPGKVPELGLQVDSLSAEVARELSYQEGTKGVVVTSVDADGPAATAGLREGLLIERVGQQRVGSVEEFQQALKGADFAKGVLFLVRNPRGVNTFIVVKKL